MRVRSNVTDGSRKQLVRRVGIPAFVFAPASVKCVSQTVFLMSVTGLLSSLMQSLLTLYPAHLPITRAWRESDYTHYLKYPSISKHNLTNHVLIIPHSLSYNDIHVLL